MNGGRGAGWATLAMLFLAGGAVSAYNRIDTDPYVAALPPTGRYIDLATRLVHEYDNATGALTPTLQGGALADFVCVETYHQAEPSACGAAAYKPGAGLCTPGFNCIPTCVGYRVCGAATAAVVGSHALQAFAVTTDCNGASSVPWSNDHQSAAVSYIRFTVGVKSDCALGALDVRLFMDGAPIGVARDPYS